MAEPKPDPISNPSNFVKALLQCVASGTRESNCLPKLGDTHELYSSFPTFAQLLKAEDGRVLQLASGVLNHAGYAVPLQSTRLDNDERLDRLVDANDAIFERISVALDEASGVKRNVDVKVEQIPKTTVSTSWNKGKPEALSEALLKRASSPTTQADYSVSHKIASSSKNIPKPQLAFAHLIDNSNQPFVPRLKCKHNAKPGRKGNVEISVDGAVCDAEELANDMDNDHPYKYELDTFQPNLSQLEIGDKYELKSLESTPIQYVNTVQQLTDLCQELLKQNEFAVDLEHNDFRTFLGLTCLMQISTRDTDYIVDTLSLWHHMHMLNDPFTNPNIVKVFHGADMDIQWLQRDFGIYVVGMFDTGQAMRVLHKGRLSLAYLVSLYCNHNLDKQYQLADWRTRPIPEAMLQYAREDTHYLLHCYDKLKEELLERGNNHKNLLKSAFNDSKNIALMVYHKSLYSERDCNKLLSKAKRQPNSRQLWAVKQLHLWRDKAARQYDESIRFTLPDHMLLQIADVLPREMQGIIACCNPVPMLVKQELLQLHQIILQARDRPLDSKMEMGEGCVVFRKQESHPLLNSVHDFSHIPENEEMETTEYGLSALKNADVKVVLKNEPSLIAFCSMTCKKVARKVGGSRKVGSVSNLLKGWASPFERYLLAVEEKERKNMETKDVIGVLSGPKRYSHHDPSSGRHAAQKWGQKDITKDTFLRLSAGAKEDNAREEEEEEEEDPLPSPNPSKKRKKNHNAYLMPLAPVVGEEAEEEEDVLEYAAKKMRTTQSIDYSKMDASIFNKKGAHTASGHEEQVFDPYKNLAQKKGQKGPKKKRGGKGNAVPRSMSFANNK